MTFPTVDELENEFVIDTKMSFKERPPSKTTIEQWKKYLNRKDHAEYSDKEVLEKLQGDPKPMNNEEESIYDKKILDEQIKASGVMIEEYHESGLVQSIKKEEEND